MVGKHPVMVHRLVCVAAPWAGAATQTKRQNAFQHFAGNPLSAADARVSDN